MVGPAVSTTSGPAARSTVTSAATSAGPGRPAQPSVNLADDIVDVLLAQHHTLRQLCEQVPAAATADRKHLLADLAMLIHRHIRGEQLVVHPVTRDRTGNGGDTVGTTCAAEEERISRAVAALAEIGVADPNFPSRFAAFQQMLLDHLAHEERDEFPRLRRRVPTQQLHSMANDIRNVQAMS